MARATQQTTGKPEVEEELAAVFAEDLHKTLMRTFSDWLEVNGHKTEGPGEITVGVGMFAQDVLAILLLLMQLPPEAEEVFLTTWWTCLQEHLHDRQAALRQARDRLSQVPPRRQEGRRR
jgi:hypothetical protein